MTRSPPPFEKFGNYLLLNQLALGGMAAVYLARPASPGAAARLLVVKRILPQIANDPLFLNMFRAEIRVCVELNHPNIVQIFDYGDVGGQPFIAMEYVESKNLREVIERAAEKGNSVPLGVAVSVVAQAASALHHAHTARNRITGEALNLIHRDVSPHNVLVGYEGNVKVIDFGVAKAMVEDAEKTRAGGIKGKVRYLAPEQIQGEELDLRSDIFSLGIVLWESLAGRQLFGTVASSDFDIMKEIVNNQLVPPSKYRPEIPPELDEIVIKALRLKRDERYMTAEEMQAALRGFLVNKLPSVTYKSVGEEIRTLFSAKINEEREFHRSLYSLSQRMLEGKEFGLESVAPTNPEPARGASPLAAGRTSATIALDSGFPRTGLGVIPSYGTRASESPATGVHRPPVAKPRTRIGPMGSRILEEEPPPRSRRSFSDTLPVEPGAISARGSHVRVRQGRAPRAMLYAGLASVFWGFVLWVVVAHQRSESSGQGEAPVRFTLEEPKAAPIRMALTSPPDAPAAAHPAIRRGGSNAALLKELVTSGFRPGQAVALRIRIEPTDSNIPTRVIVNGRSLQGSDQSVGVELGQKISVRVERLSYRPYEGDFVVTSHDVDRHGIARLNVTLRE